MHISELHFLPVANAHIQLRRYMPILHKLIPAKPIAAVLVSNVLRHPRVVGEVVEGAHLEIRVVGDDLLLARPRRIRPARVEGWLVGGGH